MFYIFVTRCLKYRSAWCIFLCFRVVCCNLASWSSLEWLAQSLMRIAGAVYNFLRQIIKLRSCGCINVYMNLLWIVLLLDFVFCPSELWSYFSVLLSWFFSFRAYHLSLIVVSCFVLRVFHYEIEKAWHYQAFLESTTSNSLKAQDWK